ncbi:MAG: hydrogenase maturation protein HypF [Acidobacteriota bacterium]|nr:hydrogenase maturation protein HypF [Acidobacteriota bacterium]
MLTRTQILIRGIVQGVGFRPHVYSLARRCALKGQVLNNTTGVLIDVEGESRTIEEFISEIKINSPPLSLIEAIEREDNLDLAHYQDFRIVESASNGEKLTPISADIATCADCLRELFDPQDRRYRYPFINCTNCGPRFTIIEGIPYDRAQTTMRDFEMCAECRAEYENPLDRRFHAEPTACAQCGPRLELRDANGLLECELRIADCGLEDSHVSIIRNLQSAIHDGKIVAVKGIGGFHLACDALNAKAVERLRQRKYREDKPFALMASSVEVIRDYCRVSEAEAELLNSARRPIVLLEKRADAAIPEAVAPRLDKLGFMLPYAPLHYLLLENLNRPLVMTSGNISDEPICYEDSDANERLHGIADYFLSHNRRIHVRTDDSVVRIAKHQSAIVLRRSRGFAPAPVKTAFKFEYEILACGAELKNTFCLARDHSAFISHHIGDLENLETLRSFTEGIEHFKRLFHLDPEIVAYDLHPEYLSTKYALAIDSKQTKIGVQHHHAHIASCMTDNRIDGEVIGVAMDGLGFGTDGCLWGGEFFVADFADAERLAHLDYIPMPGGAKAIREPWRMAAVYLHRALGNDFLRLEIPFVQELNKKAWTTLRRMIESKTNSPLTSSMGRLFDAVASLLGLRSMVNYEGQAAIELETIACRECAQGYEFEIEADGRIIKTESVIQHAVEDLLDGVSTQEVSAKFHLGVARLIANVARELRDERRLNRVALSGGVFQNMLLLENVCRLLKRDGFEVFTHSRVPTNDGGISLGQAAVANARCLSGRI